MKLKDVIKLSAVYLGREKVVEYLSDGTGANDGGVLSAVDVFTRCANLVISELAYSYVPLVKTETVSAQNGRALFASFTETVLEILSVKSVGGSEIPFTVCPEYLCFDGITAEVEYKYLPANYGLTDTVGYTEKQVPSRVLSYGAAAEFCLTERCFDESVMWRKRYCDALAEIIKPKNGRVKQRRFA